MRIIHTILYTSFFWTIAITGSTSYAYYSGKISNASAQEQPRYNTDDFTALLDKAEKRHR